MGDTAGLAPLALAALAAFPGLTVDVVMGRASASVPVVQDWIAAHPSVRLMLDAADMAAQMSRADICVGAGGMSSWERCSLGLPAVIVEVADNQHDAIAGLVQSRAAFGLSLTEARTGQLGPRIAQAIAQAPDMSARAADLCDGQGTARVLAALTGRLRPMTAADMQMLFDWRGQPHIRAASLNTAPLVWEKHTIWLEQTLQRTDGLWLIYTENDRPLGHINAVRKEGDLWHWSFYIGAKDAPKGAGGRMLAAFLHQLLQRPDMAGISAEVRADNAPSLALHRALGFRQVAKSGGRPACLHFGQMRCSRKAGDDKIARGRVDAV